MAHPGKIEEGEGKGRPFHLAVEVVQPERKKICK